MIRNDFLHYCLIEIIQSSIYTFHADNQYTILYSIFNFILQVTVSAPLEHCPSSSATACWHLLFLMNV